MKTVREIMTDNRYDIACTYIVNCLGTQEVFTRETKNALIRIWGEEEASVYMLNTRELMINIA